MSEWKVCCFWKVVILCEVVGGYEVVLDDCFLCMLGKQLLLLLIEVLVVVIVGEWQVQVDVIDFNIMLLICVVNFVIEKVMLQFQDVVLMLVEYGVIDLLFYCVEVFEMLV